MPNGRREATRAVERTARRLPSMNHVNEDSDPDEGADRPRPLADYHCLHNMHLVSLKAAVSAGGCLLTLYFSWLLPNIMPSRPLQRR